MRRRRGEIRALGSIIAPRSDRLQAKRRVVAREHGLDASAHQAHVHAGAARLRDPIERLELEHGSTAEPAVELGP
jgi:hypothetical protein